MDQHILYSTNTYLKYYIHEEFFKGLHWAWCSKYFSNESAPKHSIEKPPTSTPADIYKRLREDVRRKDGHSYKINEQKLTLTKLTHEFSKKGKISQSELKEIVYMVNHADFNQWRPLIYIIPYSLVTNRVKVVPIGKRASFDREFIVRNLKSNEFDVIEV